MRRCRPARRILRTAPGFCHGQMCRLLLLAMVLVGSPPVAVGGGLRDLEDAWLVPPEALHTLLEPAAAQRRWEVCLAQGQLHGLPELPQSGLGLARRWSGAAASADWQRLGGDLYREQVWRLGFWVGSNWRMGGRLGWSQLDLAGGPPMSHTEVDLQLQVRLTAGIRLRAWWLLGPLPVWYGESGTRRWLHLEGAGEGWSWAAVVDRAADGTPSLQGEVMLLLAPAVALGLRSEPATGTVGVVSAWRTAGLLLRTSHALHPDLGFTHRWGLVLGGGR